MRIIEDTLNEVPNKELINRISGRVPVLLDIETTGLKRESCIIYLIGLLFPVEDDMFCLKLIFADSSNEEPELLKVFSASLPDGGLSLVTFNGRRFDLPFLLKRFEMHGLAAPQCLNDGSDFDIYDCIRPYRRSFGLSSLNQKSIEKMLGLEREDKYSGGELISVYHEYEKTGDSEALELLLTHNREDVLGMAGILPALSYAEIFKGLSPLSIIRASFETHESFDGSDTHEFVIEFTLPLSVPKPRLFHNFRLFLETEADRGVLRIPLFFSELKHFFDNYKDYLYIPSEDKVVLKEIGKLLDPSKTEKAKAENCYVREKGIFLPLPQDFSVPGYPVFKEDHKCKSCYIKYSDELKSDPSLPLYLSEMLQKCFR